MKMVLALMFIGFTASAKLVTCDALLALTRFEAPTLFLEPVKYFKSTRTGQEMAYQIVPPANGKTGYFVMPHGLGNAMGSMQPLAKKFIADGYGVLLMDLYGHGRTLGRMLQKMEETNTKTFPDTFKHRDNVLDIRDLIIKEKIQDFYIVGHSHGGGVGYALANEFDRMKKEGLLDSEGSPKILSVHLLNPYVSRIDKFLADLSANPEYWVQETSKNLVKAGMDAKHVDAILDPIFEYFFNTMRTSQFFLDLLKNGMGGQMILDKILDPALESTLHKQFSDYFRKRFEAITKRTLNQDEMQLVELQVTVSLMVVKGNRDFDLLDRTQDILPVGVPVQIIGARSDTLVPMAQLKEFYLRLKQAGLVADLNFVSDIHAGHEMNETHVDEVYAFIVREMKKNEKARNRKTH